MKKLMMILCALMLGSSVMGAEMSQEDRKLAELQQTLYHAMINFDKNQISLAKDKIMKYPVKRVIAGFKKVGDGCLNASEQRKNNIIHCLVRSVVWRREDQWLTEKVGHIIWLLEEYDPWALNAQGEEGNTLLHCAIEKKFFNNCLSPAANRAWISLLFYLLQKSGINICIPNDQGVTVWDIVQKDPELKGVKKFIEEQSMRLSGGVLLPGEPVVIK